MESVHSALHSSTKSGTKLFLFLVELYQNDIPDVLLYLNPYCEGAQERFTYSEKYNTRGPWAKVET